MWRLMAVLMCVVVATGVVACGSDEGSDEPAGDAKKLEGKIAVLLPDTKSSDRWEKADRRFFGEAFKAAGLSSSDYTIKNAQGDPANQRTQAEQAITDGAKVIVLTNLDSGSGAAIIADAKSKGVTMIDYDRLTLKADADYYVSGDATEAGRLQGKGLVEDLEKAGKEKPAVAILDGAPTDSFATDLKNGLQRGAGAEVRGRRVHEGRPAGGPPVGRPAGADDLRAAAAEERQQDRRRARRQRHDRQLDDLRAQGAQARRASRRPGSTRRPARSSTCSRASSR